jgi:hypothetical protein
MNGIQLIAAERTRQVEDEGWTSAHDDGHDAMQMSSAAICYILRAQDRVLEPATEVPHPWGWPWGGRDWKPSNDPIRDLVKAGALIAAEIDRLQRKEGGGAMKFSASPHLRVCSDRPQPQRPAPCPEKILAHQQPRQPRERMKTKTPKQVQCDCGAQTPARNFAKAGWVKVTTGFTGGAKFTKYFCKECRHKPFKSVAQLIGSL